MNVVAKSNPNFTDCLPKGKTNEKLDSVGRGEAIVCQAIASVRFDTWSDSDL
jgi:2C-methyl-D-erythritol 2,4-cyclodiphosphate synthase